MSADDLTCGPAAGISWVVEGDGVRVVGASGVRVRLDYPDAALWDFMTRGVGADRIVLMLRHIAGFVDATETSQYVLSRLEHWQQQGLIAVRGHETIAEPIPNSTL